MLSILGSSCQIQSQIDAIRMSATDFDGRAKRYCAKITCQLNADDVEKWTPVHSIVVSNAHRSHRCTLCNIDLVLERRSCSRAIGEVADKWWRCFRLNSKSPSSLWWLAFLSRVFLASFLRSQFGCLHMPKIRDRWAYIMGSATKLLVVMDRPEIRSIHHRSPS